MKRAVLAGAALLACTISGYSNAALLAGWSPEYSAPGVSAGPVTDAGSSATVVESSTCQLSLASCIIIDPNGVTTPGDAVDNDRYFAFSAAATGPGLLHLTALEFDAHKGGASDDRGWVLRTSVDSFAADVDTGVLTCNPFAANDPCTVPDNFVVDLSAAQFQGLASIDFRLYAYSPEDDQTVNFANIVLKGQPIQGAIPAPFTLGLVFSGLAAVGFAARRRKSRAVGSRG